MRDLTLLACTCIDDAVAFSLGDDFFIPLRDARQAYDNFLWDKGDIFAAKAAALRLVIETHVGAVYMAVDHQHGGKL